MSDRSHILSSELVAELAGVERVDKSARYLVLNPYPMVLAWCQGCQGWHRTDDYHVPREPQKGISEPHEPAAGTEGLELPHRTSEILFQLYEEVEQTLAAKRLDYGTDNINQTGLVGVAVRLVDKTARLHHLASNGREPNHESIEDTVKDIIGYASIFKVLLEGEQW